LELEGDIVESLKERSIVGPKTRFIRLNADEDDVRIAESGRN
jgi:hypothetical protein